MLFRALNLCPWYNQSDHDFTPVTDQTQMRMTTLKRRKPQMWQFLWLRSLFVCF